MHSTRTTGQMAAWRLHEMAKDLSYLRHELPGLFDALQGGVESWCLGEGLQGDPDTLWHVLATGFPTHRLAQAITTPDDPLAPALAHAARGFAAMDRDAPIEPPLLALPHAALAALETLGYPLIARMGKAKNLDALCLVLDTPYALQAWKAHHPRTDPVFSYWAGEKRFDVPRKPDTAWMADQSLGTQTKLSPQGVALVAHALRRILDQDKVPKAVDFHAVLTTRAVLYMDSRVWAALVVMGAHPAILDAGKPAYDQDRRARHAWLWTPGSTAHAELARQDLRRRCLQQAWSVEHLLSLDKAHVDLDVVFPLPQEALA